MPLQQRKSRGCGRFLYPRCLETLLGTVSSVLVQRQVWNRCISYRINATLLDPSLTRVQVIEGERMNRAGHDLGIRAIGLGTRGRCTLRGGWRMH